MSGANEKQIAALFSQIDEAINSDTQTDAELQGLLVGPLLSVATLTVMSLDRIATALEKLHDMKVFESNR